MKIIQPSSPGRGEGAASCGLNPPPGDSGREFQRVLFCSARLKRDQASSRVRPRSRCASSWRKLLWKYGFAFIANCSGWKPSALRIAPAAGPTAGRVRGNGADGSRAHTVYSPDPPGPSSHQWRRKWADDFRLEEWFSSRAEDTRIVRRPGGETVTNKQLQLRRRPREVLSRSCHTADTTA